MSIDLVWWADTFSVLQQFAVEFNFARISGSGGLLLRPGFSYEKWGGDGKIMRSPGQSRGDFPVNLSDGKQFSFDVGATPPAWLEESARVVARDGDGVWGVFDRIQGQQAVFLTQRGTEEPYTVTQEINNEDGTTTTIDVTRQRRVYIPPAPATQLEIFQESPTFLPGVAVMVRLSGAVRDEDRLVPNEGDPDADKQFARSSLVSFVRNNGGVGTTADGIKYGEIVVPNTDNSIMRIYDYDDVDAQLTAWGSVKHEWQGGNSP